MVVAALAYSQSSDRKALKAFLAGLSSAVLAALSQVLSRAVIGLKGEPWPLDEWAGQYQEDAFEPDIAVLDAHHHLWDARVQDKGWPIAKFLLKILYSMKPRIAVSIAKNDPKNKPVVNSYGARFPPLTPYMGADFTADIKGNGRGHNVVGTVYLECGWKTPGVDQCMWPVKEVDMVTEVHSRFPKICNGIVAHLIYDLGLLLNLHCITTRRMLWLRASAMAWLGVTMKLLQMPTVRRTRHMIRNSARLLLC